MSGSLHICLSPCNVISLTPNLSEGNSRSSYESQTHPEDWGYNGQREDRKIKKKGSSQPECGGTGYLAHCTG